METDQKDTEQLFAEKAHFALFTNRALTDTIPRLKQATDGKLWHPINRFTRNKKDLDKDTLWEKLESDFKTIRNHYSHVVSNPPVYTSETLKFLQYAFDSIADPENVKKTVQIIEETDENKTLTKDGIIFFTCLMSTKSNANQFIGGLTGYKRTDDDGMKKRNLMTYYSYRDGYGVLNSGVADNTANWRKAMEILDYIRKPIAGSKEAEQANENRDTKDEQDIHSGLYDIRTSKDLFPYFVTQWLETIYPDTIAFVRKYETDPVGKWKSNDREADERYCKNLPLYFSHRGTHVIAQIKVPQNINSVILSHKDLLYLALRAFLDTDAKKQQFGRLQNHHRQGSKQKKALNDEKRIQNRLSLIQSRWQESNNWTMQQKVKWAMWALQNLAFNPKIEHVKEADALRLEMINYQGRKPFKQFMKAHSITSDQDKPPPNNRLNKMLPDRVTGFDVLFKSIATTVQDWCKWAKEQSNLENDATIKSIIGIKEATNTKQNKNPRLPFIHEKFWQGYFKGKDKDGNTESLYVYFKNKRQGANETFCYDFDTKGLNDLQFYSDGTAKKITLSKREYGIYLKDIVLFNMVQYYIQNMPSGTEDFALTLKERTCKLSTNNGFSINIPLHRLGKAYAALDKNKIQRLFIHCDKSEIDIDMALSKLTELQKGKHEFMKRWLICEDTIIEQESLKPNNNGYIDSVCVLKNSSLPLKQQQFLRAARNTCMHSNIWGVGVSATYGDEDKRWCTDYKNSVEDKVSNDDAFRALEILEKKLRIDKKNNKD